MRRLFPIQKSSLLLGLLALTLATTAFAGDMPAGKTDGKAAFEKLKTLAGNWDGKGRAACRPR